MTAKVSTKLKPWLTESGLLQLQGWARDGLTNEDIAKNIGINPKTLYDWIKKWPEIEQSLRMGKEPADRKVENALFNKATGYTEEVEKVKVLNDGGIVRYKEQVYYPPDTTAAIFWLKNRKSEAWRDKHELEHSGDINLSDQVKKIDDYIQSKTGDKK